MEMTKKRVHAHTHKHGGLPVSFSSVFMICRRASSRMSSLHISGFFTTTGRSNMDKLTLWGLHGPQKDYHQYQLTVHQRRSWRLFWRLLQKPETNSLGHYRQWCITRRRTRANIASITNAGTCTQPPPPPHPLKKTTPFNILDPTEAPAADSPHLN